MLYLTTGANGAGKTLNTLRWVRDLELKESRPVCYNGRFEPVEGGELAGWKKIDFKDWQDEPDGTIFLIDECHNDMPVRPASAPVPDAIKMLAEHRRRGMDFFLVTQHPQNIDTFVRRLIGSPGWHRHLKRTFGADMISVLEWSSVNPQCEKAGSGESGSVTMKAFPKEVYGWYKSASLHTGKKKVPWRVWFVVLAAVAVPALFYFGIRTVFTGVSKKSLPAEQGSPVPGVPGGAMGHASGGNVQLPKTAAEYVADYRPRISGLPHTAPRYDEATKPTRVPVPAACITMKSKGCRCYTQQGTLLGDVPADLCEAVVKGGYFIDFEPNMGGAVAGSAGGSFALSPGASMPRGVQSSDPAPVVMDIPSQAVQRHYTAADLVAEHRGRGAYPYLR